MILGHQKQWQFLKNSHKLGKLSHAYLFSGPESIGKKTLAVEFIKFLNCQAEKSSLKPCQGCRSCRDIEKGAYPDFILIEPEVSPSTKISTGKEEIKIAQIRKMENYLSLCPYLSSFKVAVIDKAHCMTQEAQNSFLKTLEEPKGNTLFILVTEYPETLLATVLSRVQKINFYPVKREEIEGYLKSENVSQEKAKEITELSLGKPGRAIDFIKNPQKLEEVKNKIKEIDKVAKSALYYRFQYVKNLTERKENLREILDIWLRYFRKLLIIRIKEQKGSYSLTKLKTIIENLSKTQLLLSTTNVNPKLALEVLMLEL